jgi:hypothetical protein
MNSPVLKTNAVPLLSSVLLFFGWIVRRWYAQVESATLPVATFSKFQPLTKDFLDLTNPKAVLEMRLR